MNDHFRSSALDAPRAPVAHTPNDAGRWDFLADHSQQVAQRASTFAAAFDMADAANLAGAWHDLGKYSAAFQRYLLAAVGLHARHEQDAEVAGKVDHSTAGAQHAVARLKGPWGRLLAYLIAGHHAGLPDAGSDACKDIPGNLHARLAKKIEPLVDVPEAVMRGSPLPPPKLDWRTDSPEACAFQIAFLGRMLFSTLVDADFLATAAHFNAEDETARGVRPVDWQAWRGRIDRCVGEKQEDALQRHGDSAVLRQRRMIYQRCCEQAMLPPGFFSLTVPTGGGKTLASFAMAVRHLLAHQQSHGLRRIIYAMPFTSIIEQNAQVLRDVLQADGDQLLEHHSNLDPEKITPWNRLASENWDAPLIITTTVQLYESLFAARTSACRKLHNIAGSVIVLDEAQALPVNLLEPTLAALAELVRNYKCTVILCTATQPAVVRETAFKIGLENVREVMHDPAALAEALRRVDIHDAGELDADALAQRMAAIEQVLAIVDTRARAAELFQKLRDAGAQAYHLSASMCPQHRSQVLAEIRQRLRDGQPCRVVSTQLIEAGVDVDFPVVYRALAGLDAIAQAAGRCNREGKLQRGQVHVFHYHGGADAVPPGLQRQGAKVATEFIGVDDLLAPETQRRYFRKLYWDQSQRWDEKGIMRCFKEPQKLLFDYRTAAQNYKLIEQNQRPIFIPWDEQGEALLQKILNEHQPLTMKDYRLIQRYQVQVFEGKWQALVNAGEVQDIPDRISVLMFSGRYDQDYGLKLDDVVSISSEETVI